MRRMIVVGLVLVACKQKPAEDTGAEPGHSGAMGRAGESGSAMGSRMMDAASEPPSEAAVATPRTPDGLAKRYEECLRFSNDARWGEFESCYTPEAKFEVPGVSGAAPAVGAVETAKARDTYRLHREPQLVLTSGGDVVAIVLATRTDEASKARVAYYLAHVITSDDEGRFTRDLEVFDAEIPRAQSGGSRARPRPLATKLPQQESLIAKGDPGEQANLATFEKLVAAGAAHDAKALGDLVADDVTWSVQTSTGKDLTRKALLATTAAAWKATPEPRVIERSWAAGNYVAALSSGAGVVMLAIYRFADGKVQQAWVFESVVK